MFALLVAASLVVQAADEPAVSEDAKILLETIDAIQSQEPIEDFRCEYEGSFRAMGEGAKGFKVEDGGFFDVFSGTHVQNRAGDIHDESFHRLANQPHHALTRHSLVVRKREGRAEEYDRDNDEPIGIVVIKKPEQVETLRIGSFNSFLLLERMRSFIVDPQYQCSVVDGELDSRPVKILTVSLKGFQDSLLFRYHVDLGRGGHVIRRTGYSPGGTLAAQTDIKLSSFQLNGKDVWMPTAVETYGYGSVEFGKSSYAIKDSKDPTTHESIAILDGTMVFNTHPGREEFTIAYKPGTPISDRLRKMTTEFGRQKISLKPTKAEAETMLKEQLAKAEAQKRELVAAPSEGIDWLKWLPVAGVIAVGTSLFALWRQRRPA